MAAARWSWGCGCALPLPLLLVLHLAAAFPDLEGGAASPLGGIDAPPLGGGGAASPEAAPAPPSPPPPDPAPSPPSVADAAASAAAARVELLSAVAARLRSPREGSSDVELDLSEESLVLSAELTRGSSEDFFEEALAGEHLVCGVRATSGGGGGSDEGAAAATGVELLVSDPQGTVLERQSCNPICVFALPVTQPGLFNASVQLAATASREAVANIVLGRGVERFARQEQVSELRARATELEALVSETQQEWMIHWIRREAEARNVDTLEIRLWVLGLLMLVSISSMQCFTTSKITGLLANREEMVRTTSSSRRYSTSSGSGLQHSPVRAAGLRQRHGLS